MFLVCEVLTNNKHLVDEEDLTYFLNYMGNDWTVIPIRKWERPPKKKEPETPEVKIEQGKKELPIPLSRFDEPEEPF